MPIFSHPLRPYHDNHNILKILCLVAAAFLVFVALIAAVVFFRAIL